MKFYTTTTIVNGDTGEIISKTEYETGKYRTIQIEKKYNKTEHHGTEYTEIKHVRIVRKHEQYELF